VGQGALLRPDFLEAYNEHVWQVYGYLAYRIRTREEAEDLTQLTFERALRAWDRYDPSRASIATWLLAIARNALIDHRRRQDPRSQAALTWGEAVEADLPAEPGPEQELGLSPELAAALQRLGRRERSVLALRFGGDLRTAEIAEMLDLSVANVQQILSRTLRRLRRELERERERTGVATGAVRRELMGREAATRGVPQPRRPSGG
jgi:RNA polymerase sigma-70 factor (ECF subfamily)